MMKKKIISMVLVLTMASNPFVGLAPFYVAMDKGFFKDCGLDFSMVDFDDSSASCSALLAGKVDLAYTTLDAAIIAESQYEEDMLDVTAIVDESAGADGILVNNKACCSKWNWRCIYKRGCITAWFSCIQAKV